MITFGVDLAAREEATWVARIRWENGGVRLEDLCGKVTDDQIIDVARTGHKLAIDCPFGWPLTFTRFTSDHRDMTPRNYLTESTENLDHLAYRWTDFRVQQTRAKFPLSVAADRLGRTALRCAGLQDKIKAEGIEVDRAGIRGPLVEVYPAISLYQWGIESSYKAHRKHMLQDRVADLLRTAGWLDVGPYREVLETNDDAFDALLCALTARAAALGRTVLPADDYEREHALREGWIHIPLPGSLSALVTSD